VVSVAARCYLRYGLSYRDVAELMAERGVTVDDAPGCRWVQRFFGSQRVGERGLNVPHRPTAQTGDDQGLKHMGLSDLGAGQVPG